MARADLASMMSQDEQEIRALVAEWVQATQRGDIEAILRLMSEDAVFLVPGQEPIMGQAAFEAAANAQCQSGMARPQFEGRSEIQEIQIAGEVAFMWGRLEVTVRPPGGGPSMKRAGHTLSVLKKQEGKWLLARDAKEHSRDQPKFISDNNGFDWQFINWYFHHFTGGNPFGFSSTNLGSLYKRDDPGHVPELQASAQDPP